MGHHFDNGGMVATAATRGWPGSGTSAKANLQADAKTSRMQGSAIRCRRPWWTSRELPETQRYKEEGSASSDEVLSEQMRVIGTPSVDPQHLTDSLVMGVSYHRRARCSQTVRTCDIHAGIRSSTKATCLIDFLPKPLLLIVNHPGQMNMQRSFRKLCLSILVSSIVFGQSDRGTITGTVSDQAGALIPNAQVVANNTATGIQFTHKPRKLVTLPFRLFRPALTT